MRTNRRIFALCVLKSNLAKTSAKRERNKSSKVVQKTPGW